MSGTVTEQDGNSAIFTTMFGYSNSNCVPGERHENEPSDRRSKIERRLRFTISWLVKHTETGFSMTPHIHVFMYVCMYGHIPRGINKKTSETTRTCTSGREVSAASTESHVLFWFYFYIKFFFFVFFLFPLVFFFSNVCEGRSKKAAKKKSQQDGWIHLCMYQCRSCLFVFPAFKSAALEQAGVFFFFFVDEYWHVYSAFADMCMSGSGCTF